MNNILYCYHIGKHDFDNSATMLTRLIHLIMNLIIDPHNLLIYFLFFFNVTMKNIKKIRLKK